MTCENVDRDDILDAYLAGSLTNEDLESFEEHIFACDRCLEQVEAARLARRVLSAQPPSRKPRTQIWWLAAAAAVVIVAGAALLWQTGRHPTPQPVPVAANIQAQPDYGQLARFDPPAYRPPTFRGAAAPSPAFASAMKLYVNGDFSAAAAALNAQLPNDPNPTEARYYLGISELFTGQAGQAAANLRQTIAAGDTPFRSGARLYLAKALLTLRDVAAARTELEALIADGSELAPEASGILRQLPKP